MAYKFQNSIDVLNKLLLKTKTSKEITKEIKNTISSLNRKMKRLESSGYAKYSHSYDRIKDWLNSQGTQYFSSKSVARASEEQRIDFLVKLKHFNTYSIGVKDTKENLKREREHLNERYNTSVNEEQMLNIKNAMRMWREAMGRSNVADVFTSDEARELFTELYGNANEPQLDKFFTQLDRFNSEEYSREDFVLFRDYFDFNLGIPITSANNIKFNPVNMRIYDNTYSETELTYDDINDVLLLNGVPQNINEEGEVVSAYDFLNRKRK